MAASPTTLTIDEKIAQAEWAKNSVRTTELFWLVTCNLSATQEQRQTLSEMNGRHLKLAINKEVSTTTRLPIDLVNLVIEY